ncbi:hypothetical protein ACFQO7_26310 [Catellatospora aurea]|uniref:Uncharacterized protein n=1 Tax=Catellatospora aurea TaxID=1337874 RepID=A0ABW2H4T9_9ACTN
MAKKKRSPRRRRALIAGMIVAVMLTGVGLIAGTWFYSSVPRPEQLPLKENMVPQDRRPVVRRYGSRSRRRGQTLEDLVVELDQGQRGACQVQGRASLADVVAPHLDPAGGELFMSAAVEQVQLADRGAAQPVGHQGDIIAALVGAGRSRRLRNRLLNGAHGLPLVDRRRLDFGPRRGPLT